LFLDKEKETKQRKRKREGLSSLRFFHLLRDIVENHVVFYANEEGSSFIPDKGVAGTKDFPYR